MKVQINVELPEAEALAQAIKNAADRSPFSLLYKPVFDKVLDAIKSATEADNGNQTTEG